MLLVRMQPRAQKFGWASASSDAAVRTTGQGYPLEIRSPVRGADLRVGQRRFAQGRADFRRFQIAVGV